MLAASIGFRNRPKNTEESDFPIKILLFGYMGLGDALMFQPALRELLRNFPKALIDLLVGKESQSRAILERLMEMESKKFNLIREADYKALSVKDLSRLNKDLMEQRYDLVICTYMSPAPYFTDVIRAAPVRVGHSLKSDKWYKPRPNNIFNVSVRLEQDHEHETRRHYRLIRSLTNSEDTTYLHPSLALSRVEEEYGDVFWNKYDLGTRVVIGTHFGASRAQHWKKWDDERFADVLQELKDKYDALFLHFGVASEEDQIREAAKSVESNSIHLAGKLNVFEVASLLKRSTAFLGNDSGVGHIAMAVGTPSLRIFGMSDYWGYRSLSETNTDIFKGISCSPCLQLGYLKPYNVHNCGHKNCMKLITPDEVVAEFQLLIQPK
jgi:ADP-heptose:LPS heptosyltransferase